MIGLLDGGGGGPSRSSGCDDDHDDQEKMALIETRGCAHTGVNSGECCCYSLARRRHSRPSSHSMPKSSFINHQHQQQRRRQRRCGCTRRAADAIAPACRHDKTTNNCNENENEYKNADADESENENESETSLARRGRIVVVVDELLGLELGRVCRRSFKSKKSRRGQLWAHSSSASSPFASISIKPKLYCFIALTMAIIANGALTTTTSATTSATLAGQTLGSSSGSSGSNNKSSLLSSGAAAATVESPHPPQAGDHFSSTAEPKQIEQTTTTTTMGKQQKLKKRSPEPKDSILSSLLNSLSPSGGTPATEPDSTEQRRGSSTGLHSGAPSEHPNPYYKIGQTSSDKVTLPGDILLGGLFPIHMKGTGVECGQINRDRGIQRLEAMLYALDKINEDARLLPKIKLGAILLDSCSSSTYALNQSLEFIRASINTVESSAFECKDKSTPRPKYGSKMIAGVIGGSYSEVSLQVANLLRLFRIPQVSYASTGTALSDKTLYDLFARTVPSDMFQARAIADIVLKMGWSYVSLVSSEGLYGDSGSREFIKQAANRRICIATHEKIAPTIGDSSYDQIVQNLFKRNATGVVLFLRAEDTRELLLAVKRARLVHNFAWVAADGWGTHQKLVEGVEDVAWGAITVELSAKAIPGFDQYMKELTPWGNGRNPWFSEYWQEWFGCQLQANLLAQQRLASGAQQHTGGYSRRSATSVGAAGGDQDELGRARRSASSGTSGGGCRVDLSRTTGARGNTSQCLARSASEHLSGVTTTTMGEHQQLPVPGEVSRPRRAAAAAATLDFDEEARQAAEVKQFCSPNLRISESNGYRQEQKVQFVVDAVYAMAHALHKAWSHLCDAQPGLVCEALKELNGGEFYTKYLLNVSFKDMAGSEVKFDEHGDGLGRYNIYNFRQVRSRTPPPPQNMGEQQSGLDLSVGGAGGGVPSSDPSGGGASSSSLEKPEGGVPSPTAGGVEDLSNKLSANSPDSVNANSLSNGQQASSSETTVEHIYTTNVEFEYSSVGRWTEDDYLLALEEIQFFQGDHVVPESYCSRPCELGQAKIMRAGDHCCWICKTCQPYEFLPDEFSCQDCGIGRWPVQNKTSCFDLPQKVLRWDSVYSLISLSVACLGIGLTLFVCLIFIRYIDTPVVKASGRELSFILLAGVAFCHLATFVLLSKPTTFVCGGQRFLVNFGFALMYGSLLVKTNRISRIFNCARKSAKRPSFISPKSQMLITGILVGIQIFLTIVWFIFEPPGVRADSPEGKRDEVILKCRVKGRSFILSLVYNMILITTCTIYAVKTRKIPENFNESKFIGFTMYTTIVIWLAFVTMFFGTNNSYEIQMNTMCVCISLSAYVTLFCLFSPKISIILLHPDKNVRKLTMNSATYKRAFKPVSSVASIEGGGGGCGGSGRNNNLPPDASTTAGGKPGSGRLGAGNGGQDVPSGGPVSTTSNVLNLDAQASRMQESSIISNVVNSNSGASNCSQKTPTTLSQQLALVGVCANCGAHQLASVPTTASTSTGGGGGGGGGGCGGNVMAQTGPSRSVRMTGGSSAGKQVVGTGQQRGATQAKNAKILHQKIGGAGQGIGQSGGSFTRQIKHSPSDDLMLVRGSGPSQSRHNHPMGGYNPMPATGHCPMVAGGGGVSGVGHRKSSKVGSLSRLNEMTSFTSSTGGNEPGGGGRHCIDESISSLVNDSFMNTSLENTPCNVAGGHGSGYHAHLSSSSAHMGGVGEGGAPGTHNCKGSDSMLCNQSVHSMDYCSDCCPSLCHCSCQVCSSSQVVYDIGDGPRHNSIGVLRAATTDDDDAVHYHGTQTGARAATTSGSYDAMCILQLVHQAAASRQSDATTTTTTTSDAANFAARQLIYGQPAAGETSETASGSTMVRCRKMKSQDDENDDESLDSSSPPPPPPPGGQQGRQTLKSHRRDMQTKMMSSVSGGELAGATNNRCASNRAQPRSSQAIEMRAMNAASSSSAAAAQRGRDSSGDDGESMETTTTTTSSSGSGERLAKRPKAAEPGHSLAYALQAAATSALGAAATASVSQIVAPAPGQPEVASGSSHYKHQRRSRAAAAGRQEDEALAQTSNQAPMTGSQQLGTIQASLEQVRALELARRKSMEALAAAASHQRRKSGCFNYHDDYEYSYGLVQSDSSGDSIELQAAVVAATAEAAAYLAGDGNYRAQRSSGARKPPVVVAAAAANDDRASDGANDKTSGGLGGRGRRTRTSEPGDQDNDDDDGDDDFEHDGRVSLERSYSHRRPGNKDIAQSSAGHTVEDSPDCRSSRNRRGSSKGSRSKSRTKKSTRKQQQQQQQPGMVVPQTDEHRINSVALITATLSAGGAIVESGGGGSAISGGNSAAGGGLTPRESEIGASAVGGGGGGVNQRQQQQQPQESQRKQQQQQHGVPRGGESAESSSSAAATHLGTF